MADQDGARLSPGGLMLDELRVLARGGREVRLDDACWPAVEAAARVVEEAAHGEAASMASIPASASSRRTRIAPADIAGAAAAPRALAHVRRRPAAARRRSCAWSCCSRRASLALGYSGVRGATIEPLADARSTTTPCRCVPAKGSVGASGDLAPLAHISPAPDRRRRDPLAGERWPARRGPGARRPGAAAARGQGGPGAAQRHPGVDGAGAARPVRGRAPCSTRRWSRAP